MRLCEKCECISSVTQSQTGSACACDFDMYLYVCVCVFVCMFVCFYFCVCVSYENAAHQKYSDTLGGKPKKKQAMTALHMASQLGLIKV